MNKPFVAPKGTRMLIESKDMLSLVLHLADTTPCNICVIVQDGINLITMALEDRVSLNLLAS
jgi:hypothetical protein